MFGFKKKKTNNLEFVVPVSGTIVDLEQVNDPVFSQKLMGDGFAIEPTNGEIYAPVSGEVISLFPHAAGIKTDDGMEILVHFGIDTVKLNGEGFTSHINQGDRVNAGDLIISVDVDAVKDQVPAITTPIIFTNINGHSFTINNRDVEAKDNAAVTINE